MILSQVPAFQAEDPLGGPRIDFYFAEYQALPVALEGDVPILNQPVKVGAAQMEVARNLVDAEGPVRHMPQAATLPPVRPAGAALRPKSILLFRGPPRGLLVDLIESAAIVPDQFEFGQDVPHVLLLFDLLVEEPLEE